ncbi:MAG: hypothetical protein IKZ96_01360 [Bacilli bacterium]|nr:hypothetical protein [Bacilli bacterium]
MLEEYLNDQNVVTKLLLDSIESEKTVQAYLFVCNDMNYLEKFAKAFSKKIATKEPNKKVYEQIDNNTFLDLTIISPDGAMIKKDQLSELQKEFQKKPIVSNKKIYIIKECEKMNAASANSMLKFLEEPSDDVVAILLTTNINLVLPTIISRCQVLNLNNIKNQKDIYETIKERYDSIYTEDNYDAYFSNLISFVQGIDSMKNKFFIKYKEYTDIFSTRDDMKIVIDFMLYFYYDILNLKFKRELVYFNNYIGELEKVEKNNSRESINYKLEIIEKAKLKLSTNANIKMILDKMIIEFGKDD